MSFQVGERVQVDPDLDELHHSYEDPIRGVVMVGVATMKGTVREVRLDDEFPYTVALDGDSPNELWDFKEGDLKKIG